MAILKNFVVLEGCDGSGTTSQLNTLEIFFHTNSGKMPPFYKTFEPTDGIIGKIIRSGLRKECILSPQTMAMLFAADRNEHLYASGGLLERCKRGELVVSDRYLPSSLVYQGITCGEELPSLLNKDFPYPELLIFLDIDPEIAQKRIGTRGYREIYEYPDFQRQVRRRYMELLPKYSREGVILEIIDASLPMDEIACKIWEAIQKLPIIKG